MTYETITAAELRALDDSWHPVDAPHTAIVARVRDLMSAMVNGDRRTLTIRSDDTGSVGILSVTMRTRGAEIEADLAESMPHNQCGGCETLNTDTRYVTWQVTTAHGDTMTRGTWVCHRH